MKIAAGAEPPTQHWHTAGSGIKLAGSPEHLSKDIGPEIQPGDAQKHSQCELWWTWAQGPVK